MPFFLSDVIEGARDKSAEFGEHIVAEPLVLTGANEWHRKLIRKTADIDETLVSVEDVLGMPTILATFEQGFVPNNEVYRINGNGHALLIIDQTTHRTARSVPISFIPYAHRNAPNAPHRFFWHFGQRYWLSGRPENYAPFTDFGFAYIPYPDKFDPDLDPAVQPILLPPEGEEPMIWAVAHAMARRIPDKVNVQEFVDGLTTAVSEYMDAIAQKHAPAEEFRIMDVFPR